MPVLRGFLVLRPGTWPNAPLRTRRLAPSSRPIAEDWHRELLSSSKSRRGYRTGYHLRALPTATTPEALEALLSWNVKPILEARRKQREAALRSAAANRPPAGQSSTDRRGE